MIVLLNHQSDLDGIGSQAILKRYFDSQGAQLELMYALYPTFIERIQEVMALNPEEIVIADIGFNDSFNQVFPIFEAVIKKGIKISWFDHHQVDEETQNRLKKTINLYKNDTTSCAAKIVYEHYLPKDSIAQEIAKFAYDADYNENKFPIAQELQIVIANNRNDLNKLKKISDLLSKGLFEDKFIQGERIKAVNEENEQIRNIKQNFKEISISKGKSLVF
jgi:oligoribonuclease NrnB/cAMP/cGMP phosphodiesterase (DHH superfamily)